MLACITSNIALLVGQVNTCDTHPGGEYNHVLCMDAVSAAVEIDLD